MLELAALLLYCVQWLGVVLGVGAEVVLLVSHLISLHEHKPQWFASIPAVRAAQFIGLALMVLSGAGATAFHFIIGQQELLLLPVFAFKWVLIVALVVAYLLEKHVIRGHAALEGFTGATWLALFMVHSAAPIAPWAILGMFYAAWLAVFGLGWGMFVLLMKRTNTAAIKIVVPVVVKAAPAPVVAARPAPVVPPPVIKPVPAPVVVAAPPPTPPKPVAPPPPVPVAKPVPPPPPPPKPIVSVAPPLAPLNPANLPVVEHLELTAPHTVVAPQEPVYVPDYNHLPGLRIMPQRHEDLHLHNRAPVVQPSF